jgi:hypothetical protein
MKELLTKKFWQDVKKTLDEARKDPSADGSGSQLPAAEQPDERPKLPSSSEDETGHASVRFAVT